MKQFSDDQLTIRLEKCVIRERSLTREILELLREFEKRKIYAKRGYPSLFSYLVGKLKYSKADASRKCAALNAMKMVNPNRVLEQVEKGELNLTGLSEMNHYFREKEKTGSKITRIESNQLLTDLSGKEKSAREEVYSKLGVEISVRREVKTESLSGELRIHLTIKKDLKKKMEKARELLAHQIKGHEITELLDLVFSDYLKRHDPIEMGKRREARKKQRELKKNASTLKSKESSPQVPGWNQKPTRHIPNATRDEVFKRDKGVCQFRDPKTGKACGSSYKMQVDHCYPFALGGDHSIKNLRLLCAVHNGIEAGRYFKMGRYRGKKTQLEIKGGVRFQGGTSVKSLFEKY